MIAHPERLLKTQQPLRDPKPYWGFRWLRIPGASLAVDQFSAVSNPFSDNPGRREPPESLKPERTIKGSLRAANQPPGASPEASFQWCECGSDR